ncbi:phospholipase [Pseudomonas sp. JS3066]|uniref:phospholipase D-like domain-containing protein n=1 Tax=Pseudomonas sp. JS3066 TaxID=3090665 RepID=UPI002E7AC11D|nr:phospholipase [Pseudomonas sp. JS3066]WVK91391.1 phospholipase [Pseudomonas sp. JS3066]
MRPANARHPEIVVPIALQRTHEAVCSAPWFVCDTEYRPWPASYKPLINGEEAFRAVHQAIANAERSVDIICWGFQPSMHFIRDGSDDRCIGVLLEEKARQGVQVRILGWEMPLNAAGVVGEANLPGKGGLADRAGQTSSDEQYAYDRQWFKQYAVADNKAAGLADAHIPLFVSRDFSWSERAEIAYQLKLKRLDPELAKRSALTMRHTVTHHQKSVLVDFELPERAIGFVMGHNMLDEYWDTDHHSALWRPDPKRPDAKTHAPNRGPRGALPRQDISCQITGRILRDLHHNFATAWAKETGEDLLHARNANELAKQLQPRPEHGNTLMAQLLRTQAQETEAVRDIQAGYLKAINNATQFIYIENQYFRWPPLAEAIKQAAQDQTRAERDPGKHGALHLFVITNVTKEGLGAGTVNTQRMLESLGRADTIPAVTKLLRIEKVKRDMPPQPRPDGANDRHGHRELAQWQAELDRQVKQIKDDDVIPEERPGLKAHVCSLVAPDSPAGQPWVPVYIHSKLMIVNDVLTTHGSANINTRSMQVDSELNILHEWHSVTQAMRRRLWDLHTDGKGVQDDPGDAFDAWQELINENKERQSSKSTPDTPLVEFLYDKAILRNLD